MMLRFVCGLLSELLLVCCRACACSVLYVDIDIHHGDGVEEAFYLTDRVMTVRKQGTLITLRSTRQVVAVAAVLRTGAYRQCRLHCNGI